MQDQSNGTPAKKKQIFFSIGSYSERDKRVINKISTNGPFSNVTLRNEQAPRPAPSIGRLQFDRERPASLDATDSVKHSQTLPNLRKFKPIESLVDEELNDRLIIVERNGEPQKPSCPPTSSGDNVCPKGLVQQTDGPVDKPGLPPKMTNRSLSLEPDQLRHTGKVALTIAAYEGEPRTPTRLDFLPSQPKLSRSSSKASDVSSPMTTTPLDEEANENIGSKLQNELVATLKRSNLKKRHDEHREGQTPPPSPAALQDNEIIEKVEVHVKEASGNVKKVAAVLGQSLTFGTHSKPTPTELPKEIVEQDKTPQNEIVKVVVNEVAKEEDKKVPEVEARQVPEKVVEAEAHKPSSTELFKEEKKEEHITPEIAQEIVVQVEETREGDKPSEKEGKLFENSIQKSLVDAFDEIITLTDDTEEKP